MCQETTDTRVTPTPTGQEQQRLTLSGYVRNGNRQIHYVQVPVERTDSNNGRNTVANIPVKNGDKETVLDADAKNTPVTVDDTDIDLVSSMRRTFTSTVDTKDGVNAGLFPLTSAAQKDMLFTLKGRETRNGRDTYHIVFRPKDSSEFNWKGDAWIDTQAFQPVVIRTALSRNIPLGVRLMLGTDVPGLGFTVIYAPQGEVWFPASFGTEFKLRVLFAFHRQILVAVTNHSFERTHVTSTIHAEEAKPLPPTQP